MENNNKSMLDIANDYLKKSSEPVSFKVLWEVISKEKNFTESEQIQKMSRFYTDLIMDSRFVTLGENTWDLRERQSFDKVHIDMNDVYRDVEEEVLDDDVEEENDEQKEIGEEVKEEESEENDDFNDSEKEEN